MEKRTCSVKGCDRPFYGRSYCQMHYNRWRKHGDPLISRAVRDVKQCAVEGCGRPYNCRGYCTLHYQRWAKHGDPMAVIQAACEPCSVTGCDRPACVRDFCNAHNHRLKLHGDVRADVPIQRKRRGVEEPCSTEGCGARHVAKGLCKLHYMERFVAQRKEQPCSVEGCLRPLNVRGWCVAHYQRWRAYGDPLSGGPFRKIRGTGGSRWEYDEKRRAAKAKMSQVSGETAEYVEIIRRDPCAYCGAARQHIDHVDPFADGGPTEWNNLAPACARCNHQKSRQSLLIFLLRRMEREAKDHLAA